MMERFTDPLRLAWSWLVAMSIMATLISFFVFVLHVSKEDTFSLFALILLAVVIFQLRHLSNQVTTELPERLRELSSPKGNPGPKGNPYPAGDNPGEHNADEPKPSGTGAFGGMIVGAAIGLASGNPVGVLIAGIIGALVGNQIEYENIRKKPPQKP